MPPTFPNIVCDAHPNAPPQPGWIICVHLLDCRVPIAHLVTPTADESGEMLCGDCYHHGWRTIEQLRLVCRDCVNDLLRAREMRP